MLGLRLKSLVLLAVLLAAPAAAGSRAGHHSNCPLERARLEALALQQERAQAAAVAQALRVPKGPTRVTLSERAPSAHWLSGFDGVPRSLTP